MRKNIIFLCIFSYTWDSDCCKSKGVSLQCLELCSLSSRIMPEMKPESLLSEDHPFSKCDSFTDIIYQCVGPIKQSRTWGRKSEKATTSGIYSTFFLILSTYFCYTNIGEVNIFTYVLYSTNIFSLEISTSSTESTSTLTSIPTITTSTNSKMLFSNFLYNIRWEFLPKNLC